jgi:hypothetical protein
MARPDRRNPHAFRKMLKNILAANFCGSLGFAKKSAPKFGCKIDV